MLKVNASKSRVHVFKRVGKSGCNINFKGELWRVFDRLGIWEY